MKRHGGFSFRQVQRGAAAVEFALVAMVFLMLLIGVVEFGRVLFTWNAAVEATRYGARVAAVCDLGDSAIVARMRRILPALTSANVNVSYLPNGCGVSNCQQVRVALSGMSVATYIPVAALSLAVPPFSTTLPRESLASSIDGAANPVCN